MLSSFFLLPRARAQCSQEMFPSRCPVSARPHPQVSSSGGTCSTLPDLYALPRSFGLFEAFEENVLEGPTEA